MQNFNTSVEVGQLGDSRLGALGEWKNEEDRAVGSRQTDWRIARGRGRSQGTEALGPSAKKNKRDLLSQPVEVRRETIAACLLLEDNFLMLLDDSP